MSIPSTSNSDKGICIICAKAATEPDHRFPRGISFRSGHLGHRNRDRQRGRSAVDMSA